MSYQQFLRDLQETPLPELRRLRGEADRLMRESQRRKDWFAMVIAHRVKKEIEGNAVPVPLSPRRVPVAANESATP